MAETGNGERERLIREALDRQRKEIQIPDAWKPEDEGERVVGTFLKSDKIKCTDKQGKDRMPLVFFIQPEGTEAHKDRLTLWGSANLQPQMEAALDAGLVPGQTVAIVYDGKAGTAKGYTVKRFVLAVLPV